MYNLFIALVYPIYHVAIFSILIYEPLPTFLYIFSLTLRLITLGVFGVLKWRKINDLDCFIYQSILIGVCTLISIISYTYGDISSYKVTLQSVQLFLSVLITCCITTPKQSIPIHVHLLPVIDIHTNDDCSICSESFSQQDTIKTNCGHLFHLTCLEAWIKGFIQPVCPTCPICRTPMV